MLKIDGSWSANGNDGIKRILKFEPSGDAWTVNYADEEGSSLMRGVGFFHDDILCIARGVVNQSAQLDGTVGLVQYELQTFGTLPARWYHSSLDGSLSEGLSSEGPIDGIVGEYRADYEDQEGKAFNPLRKTILETNGHYSFAWWDDEKFHYVGVGYEVSGSLFAAWGPPGSIIQFAFYKMCTNSETIEGEWFDYGRSRKGLETLTKV